MKTYLDIVQNVLLNGKWKGNRTGVRCLTTFCEVFRHNMSDGFPLLTTKKMAFKSIMVELEGFIKGITSKKWYQDRGCHIWDEWCNPVQLNDEYEEYRERAEYMGDSDILDIDWIERKKDIQKECDDLGPVYGYQWRSFGRQYGSLGCTLNEKYIGQRVYHPNGVNHDNSIDQLKRIVETLKTNPNDRRMVCSAWNPNQEHLQALPPCHYAFTLVHIDGTLNLSWKQRSCDLFLGVPFNIASYATLLLLLAKEANLKPGELVGILEDCHIYENHTFHCNLQVNREPFPLPTLTLTHSGSIFDWTHKDVHLQNYRHHSAIKAEVAV